MRNIRSKLKYKAPQLKLCLVREGTGKLALQAIRSPEDAVEIIVPLCHAPDEYFVSLHLNARHEVIGVHEVSHGTISSSLVHPREVFKAAILANSHALLVCHNHPSGSEIFPSPEDFQTTEQLLKAGNLLGIGVIDHIIVGPGQSAYSLREKHPALWQTDA